MESVHDSLNQKHLLSAYSGRPLPGAAAVF